MKKSLTPLYDQTFEQITTIGTNLGKILWGEVMGQHWGKGVDTIWTGLPQGSGRFALGKLLTFWMQNNAPKALASEALAARQSWVLIKSLVEEVRLKPRFKYRWWINADYLIIISGNELQTVGTEQRKTRLAKSVLVSSSETADERSVRSLTRALMWRLRYDGAVALLRLLKVNTATLYSILCACWCILSANVNEKCHKWPIIWRQCPPNTPPTPLEVYDYCLPVIVQYKKQNLAKNAW